MEWTKGSIEGILARGQIKIKSLSWDENIISLVLQSAKNQKVILELPGQIQTIVSEDKNVTIKKNPVTNNQFIIELPANQEVKVNVVIPIEN